MCGDKCKHIDIAVLLLRIGVGVIMCAHGMQKLFGAFGGSGIDGFIQGMKVMGFSPAMPLAWLVALGETFGGLFVLLGVLPRISAGILATIMFVAVVKVHLSGGLFAKNGGFEYPLILFVCCIALALTGGGKYSFFNKL